MEETTDKVMSLVVDLEDALISTRNDELDFWLFKDYLSLYICDVVFNRPPESVENWFYNNHDLSNDYNSQEEIDSASTKLINEVFAIFCHFKNSYRWDELHLMLTENDFIDFYPADDMLKEHLVFYCRK